MIIMVPIGRIQRRKRTGAGVNESCETRFDAVARIAVAFRRCKRQGNRLSPGPPHLWEPQY